ncbi:unnamed protein product [Pleuronectes platessa]|uniref:Uncharacterized protein n=1 Tax=Pleuronectes platessa TaxID=8262 RepID=A0A9N7U8R3_PLEPL|nr:unnamed protein product [Pleuronectes platessa]
MAGIGRVEWIGFLCSFLEEFPPTLINTADVRLMVEMVKREKHKRSTSSLIDGEGEKLMTHLSNQFTQLCHTQYLSEPMRREERRRGGEERRRKRRGRDASPLDRDSLDESIC